MGKGIIKIKDKYFEWSSILDEPLTYAMTLDELHDYIKEEYGSLGLRELPQRMERVETVGVSYHNYKSLDDFLKLNRAGKNGKTLTADEIYEEYSIPLCRNCSVKMSLGESVPLVEVWKCPKCGHSF